MTVTYYTNSSGTNTCAAPGNTNIYIYGSNFGTSQGTVTFNGTSAGILNWENTFVFVTVPSGATTGIVKVQYGTNFGNGPTFVVGTPGISPTSGQTGTNVTASNICFNTSSVKFNGTTATYSQNSHTVSTTVPSGATSGNLVLSGTLTGGDGNNYNYSNSFSFTAAPSITSASPNPTTVGTSVTIGGSNFGTTQGSSSVTFNGVAATSIGSWGVSSITATVPTNATTGNLVVTVNSVASNNWSFTVTPNQTSLSVNTGPAGTAFTISGSGFGTTQGSNTVTVGGVTATVTSWGAASISTSVPSAAPIGADNVIVKVNGVSSNTQTFTVTTATTTTLGSSLNPSAYGNNVTFTATVSPSSATGTVTFKDSGTSIGTGNLSGGVATLTIPWLNVATHTITAVYGGNGAYGASTSSAVSQVVNGLSIALPSSCTH